MHHACGMRRAEAREDLTREPEHLRHGQLAFAPQHARQIRAVNERHRQVLDSADIAKIVNTNDVLMGNLTGEHELALEAPFEFGG